MGDLEIAKWIEEINKEIEATVQLIAPLHHINQHEWAKHLENKVEMMRDAVNALQRIGHSQGKRVGRPPLWLQELGDRKRPKSRKEKQHPAEGQPDV